MGLGIRRQLSAEKCKFASPGRGIEKRGWETARRQDDPRREGGILGFGFSRGSSLLVFVILVYFDTTWAVLALAWDWA
jgi:hypothetical protein